VRAVLGPVRQLRVSGRQGREEFEDGFRPLEPLAVAIDEQRDLVLALTVLLSRRYLLRDEIDAELSEPLADGRRVWAPLGLVEREHEPMLDASPDA
jgi:hypothetical protein